MSALQNAVIHIQESVLPDVSPVNDVKVEGSEDLSLYTTFLGMDDVSDSDREKIQEIKEWVEDRADKDRSQIEILRDIKYRLGSPSIGTKFINHIYKYIKLRSLIKQTEDKVKLMES